MRSGAPFSSRMEEVSHPSASEISLVLYGLQESAAVLTWPKRRKMFVFCMNELECSARI